MGIFSQQIIIIFGYLWFKYCSCTYYTLRNFNYCKRNLKEIFLFFALFKYNCNSLRSFLVKRYKALECGRGPLWQNAIYWSILSPAAGSPQPIIINTSLAAANSSLLLKIVKRCIWTWKILSICLTHSVSVHTLYLYCDCVDICVPLKMERVRVVNVVGILWM